MMPCELLRLCESGVTSCGGAPCLLKEGGVKYGFQGRLSVSGKVVVVLAGQVALDVCHRS